MPRVSFYTGRYISLEEGIKEDVFSRCLTLAGERWWREKYGTRFSEFLGAEVTLTNLDELRSEIMLVLAPARNIYKVLSVRVIGQEALVSVGVTVQPLGPNRIREFEIILAAENL